MFEKCQHAQTAGLFPPYCVDFPCNPQRIAASNRLVWRKNPLPSVTVPIFKQGRGRRRIFPRKRQKRRAALSHGPAPFSRLWDNLEILGHLNDVLGGQAELL